MNHLDLHTKLINTRCLEGGNIHKIFNQLAVIQQQLESAGVTISDEEYASILCNSLPKSYESIIAGITAVEEMKTITADIVTKFDLEAYNCKCHGHIHKSIFLFSLLSLLSRHWGAKIRWSVTYLASSCICHMISHVTGQVLLVT